MRRAHRTGSPVTLMADISDLGQALGLIRQDSLDANVTAAKSALADRKDWLLIFDNAPDQSSVSHFIPVSDGKALISSRSRDWQNLGNLIQLDVMTTDESVVFLRRRTGRDELQAAQDLAAALDNLPLALSQAGAYVAAYGTSIAGYLTLFRQAAARLLATGPIPPDYPATVATTWLLHFEALAQAKPAALDVLALSSFMAPDAIPIGLLLDNARAEDLPEALAAVSADPLERDLAMERWPTQA